MLSKPRLRALERERKQRNREIAQLELRIDSYRRAKDYAGVDRVTRNQDRLRAIVAEIDEQLRGAWK